MSDQLNINFLNNLSLNFFYGTSNLKVLGNDKQFLIEKLFCIMAAISIQCFIILPQQLVVYYLNIKISESIQQILITMTLVLTYIILLYFSQICQTNLIDKNEQNKGLNRFIIIQIVIILFQQIKMIKNQIGAYNYSLSIDESPNFRRQLLNIFVEYFLATNLIYTQKFQILFLIEIIILFLIQYCTHNTQLDQFAFIENKTSISVNQVLSSALKEQYQFQLFLVIKILNQQFATRFYKSINERIILSNQTNHDARNQIYGLIDTVINLIDKKKSFGNEYEYYYQNKINNLDQKSINFNYNQKYINCRILSRDKNLIINKDDGLQSHNYHSLPYESLQKDRTEYITNSNDVILKTPENSIMPQKINDHHHILNIPENSTIPKKIIDHHHSKYKNFFGQNNKNQDNEKLQDTNDSNKSIINFNQNNIKIFDLDQDYKNNSSLDKDDSIKQNLISYCENPQNIVSLLRYVNQKINFVYHIDLTFENSQKIKSKELKPDQIIESIFKQLKIILFNKSVKLNFNIISNIDIMQIEMTMLRYLINQICNIFYQDYQNLIEINLNLGYTQINQNQHQKLNFEIVIPDYKNQVNLMDSEIFKNIINFIGQNTIFSQNSEIKNNNKQIHQLKIIQSNNNEKYISINNNDQQFEKSFSINQNNKNDLMHKRLGIDFSKNKQDNICTIYEKRNIIEQDNCIQINVEDEYNLQSIHTLMFSKCNIGLNCCFDGLELKCILAQIHSDKFINKSNSNKLIVILLDHVLDNDFGQNVIKESKGIFDLKIIWILLSSTEDSETIDNYLQLGVVKTLEKPITISKIKEVNDIINNQKDDRVSQVNSLIL